MPTTLEEKVDALAGRVEEHSYAWQDLKEAIRETNQRITHMEQKFDQRFIQMDQRFAQIDQRFIHIDQRFIHIEQRIDKLFFFILATLASSIGALISALVSIFVR